MGVVLALDTQFKSSSVETNSVGLNSGFFAARAALTFSSNFCETVALMDLAAGRSIPSWLGCCRLFPFIVEVSGSEVKESDDEDVVEEELVVVEVIESVSESESGLKSRLSSGKLICGWSVGK